MTIRVLDGITDRRSPQLSQGTRKCNAYNYIVALAELIFSTDGGAPIPTNRSLNMVNLTPLARVRDSLTGPIFSPHEFS